MALHLSDLGDVSEVNDVVRIMPWLAVAEVADGLISTVQRSPISGEFT
ncbi:hypothetical protein OAG71_00285 [bacterium]|nr:hypothetical protein [bacterium]